MTTLAKTLYDLTLNPDFVNLHSIMGIQINIKYATSDNFMSRDLYGQFKEPFLHQLAADKLGRALEILRRERPELSLLVFDALRPRSIQRVLWAHVVGTPQEIYVADPERGSMHNYGCAVDLTLVDKQNHELDMGTAFDTFTPLSQPKLEEEHLRHGLLTSEQIAHRLILRRAMTGAGFLQLAHEWWHYDAFPADEVRSRFKIIE